MLGSDLDNPICQMQMCGRTCGKMIMYMGLCNHLLCYMYAMMAYHFVK